LPSLTAGAADCVTCELANAVRFRTREDDFVAHVDWPPVPSHLDQAPQTASHRARPKAREM
jgi:hypothetical protein